MSAAATPLNAKWTPKLISSLRHYSAHDFVSDLIAGLTVGLVALPLAMAFGIASGVAPQVGIYTAVVAGFIISALGGSRCQIGGPTGAFVVIVAGIIAKFGMSGLLVVTVMAGGLLVVMGLTGLGAAVKFIPRPVTIGFTNGIAVLIASTQIKDFLGLATPPVPSDFMARLWVLGKHMGSVDGLTAGVAIVSLATILLVPRFTKRVPGSIVALVLATLATALLHLPIATIGTKFGGDSIGLASFGDPPVQGRSHCPAPAFGDHSGFAGRDRKPIVGRCSGWHERRSAQFECRTCGSGFGQPGGSIRWRHTCHWSNRAHGDQYQIGCKVSSGWNCPCAYTFTDPPCRSAIGSIHTAGNAFRSPICGRL